MLQRAKECLTLTQRALEVSECRLNPGWTFTTSDGSGFSQPRGKQKTFSLFSNNFSFPRCWTGHPTSKNGKKRFSWLLPAALVLMYCKRVFLMLNAVSLLASSSASSHRACPPPPFMSWWEFLRSTLKQMFFLLEKKKNQFHRRCKDAITLRTEYKPVSCLTIWFQLNYLYMPYFQGWGDRFEACLLKRCSLRALGLVVNYATFLFCSRLGWVSAGTFQSEQGGEGRGAQRHGWALKAAIT